jgi:hypothetical protein
MNRVQIIFNTIKNTSKEIALKYLSARFISGKFLGLKSWLMTYVVGKLWQHVINPFLDLLKRKTNKYFRRKEYNRTVDRIKESKNEDDLSDNFSKLP